MTMAAAIESRTADELAWSKSSRIAGVDIFHDLAQAEAIWRALEDPRQFSTPYQRFDFLGHWQRQVGAREGLSPFIVIACDAERRPLLLLPLTLKHQCGVGTACFMGGKHATFNMALWNGDFAGNATAVDLEALISGIRARSAADVLALTRQPLRWRDLPNPMALLPSQPSVNDCPLMTIVPDEPPTARSSGCSTGSFWSSRCGWRSRNCPTCSPSPASRNLSAVPAWHRFRAAAASSISTRLNATTR